MVRRFSFPCLEDICIVGPVVILLFSPSLLKRSVGTQPTNVGEACESDE